jgi:two-component system chemotaxis sensor kinase CheA
VSKQEKYRRLFRQEAAKLLGAIAGNLLDLEEDPSLLPAIHQDLHTLKGSARLVGLVEVGELAHRLEDFCAAETPCASGHPESVDTALEALDALEGLVGLGKPEPTPEEYQSLLERLTVGSAPAPPPTPDAPSDDGPGEPPPSAADQEDSPVPLEATAAVDAPREPLQIPIEELDELLTLTGELLIQRHRMAARFDQGRRILHLIDRLRGGEEALDLGSVRRSVQGLTRDLEGDMVEAGFLFTEVRDRMAGVRLQPFSTLTEGLVRQVRADARRLGKKLELDVRGGHLPLDRGILEYLRPVLLHTVTNAVTHGIEPPEERLAAGKEEAGTVRIQARVDGNRIRIRVEDDGRGMDPGILREAAVRKGLISENAAQEIEDSEALLLIFTPGFSTAEVVSDLAGRGVGMDAVRANVERLRGQITVESERGHYTRVNLVLPASIGVVHAMLVRSTGETVAIPMESVARTLRSLEELPGGEPDKTPRLRELLGWEDDEEEDWEDDWDGALDDDDEEEEPPSPSPEEETERPWWIELKDGEERVVIRVDEVLRELELVLKHPGRLLMDHPYLSGATILPEGDVALVLNGARLVHAAKLYGAEVRPSRGRILIADDSPIARMLLRESLESAGWDVDEAEDGMQALNMLLADLDRNALPDAVVTDWEMPQLDGLGLLQEIQELPAPPPVFLLTSQADEIRARGQEGGAAEVLAKGDEAHPRLLRQLAKLAAGPAVSVAAPPAEEGAGEVEELPGTVVTPGGDPTGEEDTCRSS